MDRSGWVALITQKMLMDASKVCAGLIRPSSGLVLQLGEEWGFVGMEVGVGPWWPAPTSHQQHFDNYLLDAAASLQFLLED